MASKVTESVPETRPPAQTAHSRGGLIRLTLLLVLTGCAILWLGMQFWSMRAEMQLDHIDHHLEELSGTIMHLDEVLTMSARMAAATQDPAWEERYHEFEPQLNDAIDEIRQIQPEIANEFIAETDAANQELVKMEDAAFTFVRQNDQPAAIAILNSPEYTIQKQRYADGILKLTATLDVRVHDMTAMQNKRLKLVTIAILAVLVSLSLFWLALIESTQKRIMAEHLARQAAEQARSDLELRVAEATAGLSSVNRQLEADMEVRRRSEDALRDSERFARSTVDALSAHLAILDETGTIITINNAWRRFAVANSAALASVFEGANYLAVCDAATGPDSEGAAEFAAGIRSILQGTQDEFMLEYPCHSAMERRWFIGRVTRFPGEGAIRLVVAHENITIRKQAEEALRTSQQLIEGIINAIPLRVFWKDRNLVYLGCNAAFARDAGFADPKDLIGKDDYQMGWRDQADLYRHDDRQTIESGQSKNFIEEPQTTPDGKTITLLTSKMPLRRSDGEISGVLGIYMDITERIQGEEALRQSEERNRTILQTAMAGFWLVDMQGRLLEVNEAYSQMSGFSAEELLTMSISDLVVGKSDAVIFAQLQKIKSMGEDIFTSKHRRKDGSHIDVEISAQYQPADGGRVVVFLEDVTQRNLAEEALRESETRFRQVTENIHEVFFLQSPDFSELPYISPAFEDIFGLSCESLYANPKLFIDAIHPDDREKAIKTFAPHGTLVECDVEFRIVRPDGTIRWLRSRTYPIRNESGVVYRFAGISEDITESKIAIDQINSQKQKLEQNNRRLSLLGEMTGLLQTVVRFEEAAVIVGGYMEQIHLGASGAIYLFRESRNSLDLLARWGELALADRILPDECWAMRRGQSYQPAGTQSALRCKHVLQVEGSSAYQCLPMMAEGGALGLLHVIWGDESPATREDDALFAQRMSEQLGLALANFRLRETLRVEAMQDSLTGLFNRRFLEISLKREFARAGRENSSVAVMMLDVDHFKRFNDAHGHGAGDTALRQLGQVLMESCRAADLACRFGGEEFTVVLPGATRKAATAWAERLLGSVRGMRIVADGMALPKISISIGIAFFPEHGLESGEVIHAADQALYAAKHAGRDRYLFSTEKPVSGGGNGRGALLESKTGVKLD